jgi:hypothetical protein
MGAPKGSTITRFEGHRHMSKGKSGLGGPKGVLTQTKELVAGRQPTVVERRWEPFREILSPKDFKVVKDERCQCSDIQ